MPEPRKPVEQLEAELAAQRAQLAEQQRQLAAQAEAARAAAFTAARAKLLVPLKAAADRGLVTPALYTRAEAELQAQEKTFNAAERPLVFSAELGLSLAASPRRPGASGAVDDPGEIDPAVAGAPADEALAAAVAEYQDAHPDAPWARAFTAVARAKPQLVKEYVVRPTHEAADTRPGGRPTVPVI